MANTYSAGIVTAYGAAKKAGYTGTYEEFCAEQASFARNAQKVRQDKESVEQTVETFSKTTVPAAVQSVTDEGTAQVGLVTDAGTTAVGNVNDAGTTKVSEVNQAGATQVGNVNTAGDNQVSAVNSAGQTQVGNVNDAGTTQVGNVQNEGATQVQAVEDKGAEVLETIPADYTKLSNAVFNDVTGLDTKAPVILETASGAIASFSDGADSMPIKKLVAQIEPVQDLHGYANPWPAGGNVNKCPSISSSMTFAGVTLSPSEDGKCKLVGTATSSGGRTTLGTPSFELPAGTYYLSSNIGYDSAQPNAIQLIVTKHSDNSVIVDRQQSAFTLAEATEIYIGINVKSGAVYNAEFYIQVESGSAPTSYSPYSNECPISGWTGAEISGTGVNVWDEEWEVGDLNTNAGGDYPSTDRIRSKNYIELPPDTSFYNHSPNNLVGCYYDENKQFIRPNVIIRSNSIFSVPANARYLRFSVSVAYGLVYKNDISINYPATDTEYHPYTGNQISVNWKDEAGTVCGGTVDVVSGKLIVTMNLIDLGTLTWYKATGFDYRFIAKVVNPKYYGKVICETYKNNDGGTTDKAIFLGGIGWYADFIAVQDYSFKQSTAAEFRNAVTGIKAVYQLATPTEYQLTPQEVKTLLGTNNIWASTGDTEVTYPADTKLYIDGKLAEIQATILENIGG